MKRRSFIFAGALSGISFHLMPFSSCTNKTNTNSTVQGPVSAPFELEEISIRDLQLKMNEGTLTSSAITKMYLDRIAAIDKKGPALHAVVEVNPDALKIAAERDEERKNKKVRGLLHGIPVLIKENIDTADQMQTTAGALALLGTCRFQISQSF